MENWRTAKLRLISRKVLVLLISAFFFHLSALSSTIHSKTALDIRQTLTGTAPDFRFQSSDKIADGNKQETNSRRLLIGLGSQPPRCTGKCGSCRPCNPVRVAVPPGRSLVNAEYYPEVWRCKCRDRLYMP